MEINQFFTEEDDEDKDPRAEDCHPLGHSWLSFWRGKEIASETLMLHKKFSYTSAISSSGDWKCCSDKFTGPSHPNNVAVGGGNTPGPWFALTAHRLLQRLDFTVIASTSTAPFLTDHMQLVLFDLSEEQSLMFDQKSAHLAV